MAGQQRRVIWTESARSALDKALSYIAQESPQGARSLLHQVLDCSEMSFFGVYKGALRLPILPPKTFSKVFFRLNRFVELLC